MRRAEAQLARARRAARACRRSAPGRPQDAGLRSALASLTARSPVPLELSVPAAPLPEEIVTAVYFVCSEALANVIKYAGAAGAAIAVSVGGGRVRVVVSDDGAGGADPAGGTGLRGLADRLEALGGTLELDSPPGAARA